MYCDKTFSYKKLTVELHLNKLWIANDFKVNFFILCIDCTTLTTLYF